MNGSALDSVAVSSGSWRDVIPADRRIRVALFGTGSFAERAWHLLAARPDFEVVVIADNNTARHGTMWHGVTVTSARRLTDHAWDRVLVASIYGQEICRGLVDAGIDGDRVVVLSVDDIVACLDEVEREFRRVDRMSDTDGIVAGAEMPRVLLLTHGVIDDSHGTGVALRRLFSRFDRERLFSIHLHGTTPSSMRHARCLAVDFGDADQFQQLADELARLEFVPDVVYTTACSHMGLDTLERLQEILPRDTPIIHHVMDFLAHDPDTFLQRFRQVLARSVRGQLVWALTDGLAHYLEAHLDQPVEKVSPLLQSIPLVYRNDHRPFDESFCIVMVGNLWQPPLFPVIQRIWRRCRDRLPGLRPIDWYVHPLRVQTLVEAGYEIGDEVIWRGFVPDLQARLRQADLALMPFNCGAVASEGYSRFSLPSRLTEYCAAGLPVFALASADTEPARFISAHEIGWVCDVTDEEMAADSLVRFIRDIDARRQAGCRSRIVAERNFDLAVGVREFHRRLCSVARSSMAALTS